MIKSGSLRRPCCDVLHTDNLLRFFLILVFVGWNHSDFFANFALSKLQAIRTLNLFTHEGVTPKMASTGPDQAEESWYLPFLFCGQMRKF